MTVYITLYGAPISIGSRNGKIGGVHATMEQAEQAIQGAGYKKSKGHTHRWHADRCDFRMFCQIVPMEVRGWNEQ